MVGRGARGIVQRARRGAGRGWHSKENLALRIIAGELRGRRLKSPPEDVRPTGDRVRESVFSRLGDVAGLRVLDLFAGSGVLGIESLSRGAECVVSVDRARRVVAALEENVRSLGLQARVEVRCQDARGAMRALAREGRRFDLVFADPPYAAELLGPALECLVATGLLAEAAVVVVESSKRHPLPPVTGLEVDSERTYGDTVVTWLEPTDKLSEAVATDSLATDGE